jgi:hypothetical protein
MFMKRKWSDSEVTFSAQPTNCSNAPFFFSSMNTDGGMESDQSMFPWNLDFEDRPNRLTKRFRRSQPSDEDLHGKFADRQRL